MNRRAFLAWLGGTVAGAAAAHVLDVDRLLWMPGERTIYLPEPHRNTFLTPEWVTREVAKMFTNNLKMLRAYDRSWDREFA